jgi:hypothetical protein
LAWLPYKGSWFDRLQAGAQRCILDPTCFNRRHIAASGLSRHFARQQGTATASRHSDLQLRNWRSVVKAILLLLASLVFLVTIFMCGVFFTAYVIAEPEPHKFAHIDTPDLWTSKPVKVATDGQSYDRLPAVESARSVPASDLPGPRGIADQQAANVQSPDVDQTVTGSLDPQDAAGEADVNAVQTASGGAVDPARAEWCYARYRSYRVEDNSYQPFSGGPRRQCEAPGAQAHQAASALPRGQGYDAGMQDADTEEEQAQLVAGRATTMGGAQVQGASHEDWCLARYRSYRAEDNSYQPFDGGPRRACQSPFG